jgi:DNA-binding NtrC family response regulator
MLLHLVLAVEPEPFARRLKEALQRQDLLVNLADMSRGLLAALRGQDQDLVLLSRSLLSGNPATTIGQIRDLPERPGVIVFEDDPDEQDRAGLLAHGCLAVLSSSLPVEVLLESLDTLIQRQRQEAIDRIYAERPEERYGLGDFISDSPTMQGFVSLTRKVVRTDTSVLILGETGVGKERLARAIHAESPRSPGPFIPVLCAALPEGLVESELFGHEAGAFTGASRARKGLFELAHKGTLFLDEVGEIPAHVQVKLLRALEDRCVLRIGAEKPTKVNVRIIAATNRDLEAEVARNCFRRDLFFRLSVVTLTIPPLRDRHEDIEKLALAYLEHFRQQLGRSDIAIEPAALDVLVRYGWPGNVRELINAVEQAVLLCSENRITVEDLPRRIATAVVSGAATVLTPDNRGALRLSEELLDKPLPEARAGVVSAFERAYVVRLLQATQGRIGETAQRAGVNQRHLYDLMKRLELRKEDFKGSRRD